LRGVFPSGEWKRHKKQGEIKQRFLVGHAISHEQEACRNRGKRMKSWKVVEAATTAEREKADTLLHQLGARGDAPPQRDTSEEMQQSGYVLRYWLAEAAEDNACGAAVLFRQPWRPPGVFSLQIGVVPEKRRQGMGSALFHEALSVACSLDAKRLLAEVDGNNSDALAFAQGHGFTLIQQFRTMVLDVADFPFARFSPLVERAAQKGVHVFSFAEVGDTVENRRKLYELNKRLAPDIPGNGEEFPDFEEYTHEIIEADWFRSEGQFIAARGEQWVGLMGIGFDSEKTIATHEFTAVDRAFRGQGIGQALKVRGIGYAAALGAKELRTGNDEQNAAMLAINRKLGYREQLGVARLERVIED
jgi:RimJ/RimL family protein N-acetyltransferase